MRATAEIAVSVGCIGWDSLWVWEPGPQRLSFGLRSGSDRPRSRLGCSAPGRCSRTGRGRCRSCSERARLLSEVADGIADDLLEAHSGGAELVQLAPDLGAGQLA